MRGAPLLLLVFALALGLAQPRGQGDQGETASGLVGNLCEHCEGGESGASGDTATAPEDDAEALVVLKARAAKLAATRDAVRAVMEKLRAAGFKNTAAEKTLESDFQDTRANLELSAQAGKSQEYQQSLTSLVKMVKLAHHVHDDLRRAAAAFRTVQKWSKENDALRRNVTSLRESGVRMCHHAVERTTINANIAKRQARLGDMEAKRFREIIVGKLASAHESSLKANSPGLNSVLIRTFLTESVRLTKEAGKARDKLEHIQKTLKSNDLKAEVLMNRAHDMAEECKVFYKDSGLGAPVLPTPPVPVPADWASESPDRDDSQSAAAKDGLPRFRGTAVKLAV